MEQGALGQVIDALHFAAYKHRYQRRKDVEQTPYINHPIELLRILFEDGGVRDPVVLVSALLHDTVEDTETTLEEIRSRFGADVAAVVEQVTDDKSQPQDVRKQLQIDHAADLSDRAKLVKLADKTANLRNVAQSPPPDWSLERRANYCNWGKRVVDEMRGIHSALEALFDETYEAAYKTCNPQFTLEK
ncbi:HD domain-containing protein [Oscillatoria sp. CS-180]|uniref:HD domain-containing protein n=1 Tax=Oscillatoria sp. CS-180 TaxID=3021720 RepID=UPI00232CC008|nr:HD domain-containing protein [Oscillatoria sp. CS-180]MDB9524693.1 HD domain-containing protein [Oscillatoria sp. CS-180]